MSIQYDRGTNGNQNYSNGARILTRVLAPPGGASSFSLGGYPPEKAYPKKHAAITNNSNNSYDRSPEQRQSNNNNSRQRRDSMDRDLMDQRASGSGRGGSGIPGLESHYSNRGGGYEQPSPRKSNQQKYQADNDYFSGGGRKTESLSQNDYAAMLREQINAKKRLTIDQDENEGYSSMNRRMREPDAYEQRSAPSFDKRGSQSYDNNDSNDSYNNTATTTRGPLASNDYAALLRQDIEDKKRYNEVDPSSRRISFLRAEEEAMKPKRRAQNSKIEEVSSVKGKGYGVSGSTKYMQVDKTTKVVVPSVKVRAPPGGVSSFSLGWGV